MGRTLLAVALVLTLLGVSAYLLRGQLFMATARLVLFDYGVALHDMKGLRIGPSRLEITSLQFSLPGAVTRSSVENLQVTFTLRELLNGQLRQILVSKAGLQLATSGTSGTAPFAVPDTAPFLAGLVQFPVAAIDIDSLSISPWLNAASLHMKRDARELIGTIDATDLQVRLRANWHDTEFISSHLIPENELSSRSMAPDTSTASLQVHLQNKPALILEFSSFATDKGQNLDLDAKADLSTVAAYARASTSALAPFAELDGQLELQARALVPDDASTPHQFTIAVNPSLLSLPLLNELVLLQIETLKLDGQCTPSGECTLSQTMQLAAATQSSRPLALTQAMRDTAGTHTLLANGLSLRGSSQVQTSASGMRVELQRGFDLALEQLHIDTLETRAVGVHVDETMTLQWDNASAWQLHSAAATLRAPQTRFGERQTAAVLTLRGLGATGHFSNLSETRLSVNAHLHELSTNALPFTLRTPEVLAQVELDGTLFSLSTELRAADRVLLNADVNFNPRLNEGVAVLRVPLLDFSPGSGSLAWLFTTSAIATDIVAGSLEADAELNIRRSNSGAIVLEGPLHAQLKELSGFVGETAILGVNADLQLRLKDDFALQSSMPMTVTVTSIDPGIPMQNIAADVEFDTGRNTFSIASLEASVFDGHVRSEGGRFSMDNPEGSLQLQLEQINLASILALSAYEGVAASGLVSGTLPVSLRDGAVSIAAGTLFAEFPGGNIRYAGSGADTGNAALDFVNKTLSNYQYDVMETGVEYLPNGELALAVKLQGTNPDTNPGQRINLNLNISDNIPSLLRSLQAGRTITDAVEQHLQSR